MEEEKLQRLRNAIERQLGYGLNTPYDFKHASEIIVAKTGRSISPTTLMRVWGYVRDGGANYSPSIYSLSTLAMFLGYLDFKDFAAHNPELVGREMRRTASRRK